MEGGNDLALQLRSKIDQHVAATDEIQPGKRRILAKVLARKDAQIANPFDYLIPFFSLNKKAPYPLGRHLGETAPMAGAAGSPSAPVSSEPAGSSRRR